MHFTALGLSDPVVRGVRAAGYTTPTAIQKEAIPLILPGYDVVASAETGSGKTAAFVLPIITRLLEWPKGLRALVLVPTRELAAQVEACARGYARFAPVRVYSVFGGVPIQPQERRLRNDGVELLIATPGRLLDLHGRQSVCFEDIEILVLDEADRMVDMGFARDLKRIISLLPKDRQTLMFSATMPPQLNAVAREALSQPRRLSLAPPTRPADGISQSFYPVSRHLKTDLLHEILTQASDPTAIVFARTRRGAERLARGLKARGHKTAALHGDRTQGQREKALKDFRRGRVSVLVATDIASRGIDVDDVTHVINFDVPHTPEDYIHRIGRTGRMDNTGDALTLVSPEERKEVAAIERSLGHKVRRVTVPRFDYEKRAVKTSTQRKGRASSGRGRGSASARLGSQVQVPAAVSYGRTPKRTLGASRRRKRI
jgi:ATP-dependent RNA helicase RhlE